MSCNSETTCMFATQKSIDDFIRRWDQLFLRLYMLTYLIANIGKHGWTWLKHSTVIQHSRVPFYGRVIERFCQVLLPVNLSTSIIWICCMCMFSYSHGFLSFCLCTLEYAWLIKTYNIWLRADGEYLLQLSALSIGVPGRTDRCNSWQTHRHTHTCIDTCADTYIHARL